MTAPIITLDRMPESSGDLQSQVRRRKYCLTGIFDEAQALAYCMASIPVMLPTEGLFRQTISMSSPGGDLWYADVPYGAIPRMVGEWSISGSTTGGTVHKSTSLACVHAYTLNSSDETIDTPALGDAGEGTLAIGYREDNTMSGADVIVPMGQRTYTCKYAKGTVTEAYMDYIESLTGIVNSEPWHGRPAGEVLFMGCPSYNTSVAGYSECSIAFQFSFSKNVYAGAPIGQFGVSGKPLNKDGHDLIDVLMGPCKSTGKRTSAEVKKIIVHRIYNRLPFLTYLGF